MNDRCATCPAPVVCVLCEACAAHCSDPAGPDACYAAALAWRAGASDEVEASSGAGASRPPPEPPRWSRS